MTIYTPQVASLCGAVDSDAVADGQPFSAHWLRPLIRSANRLIGKAQPLANLFWPEVPAGEENIYPFEGIAPTWWVRSYAPIHVRKRPGLSTARINVRVMVPSGQEVEVYFATTVRPWNPQVTYDKLITGSGGFELVETTEIPIAEGTEETFELWLRGRPTSSLANTTTYGAPNTRSSASPTGTYTIAQPDTIDLTTADWNAVGSSSLAQGGHFIRFLDPDGNQIGGPRVIVSHYGVTALRFTPPLNPYEMARADDDLNGGSDGDFEIYAMPSYAFSNILIIAEERSP